MRRRRCARSERERDADGNDRTDDEREHDAAARTPQRFAWHRAIVARFGPRRRVSAPAAPRRDLAGLIGQVHLPRVLLTKKARWRMQGRSPDDQAFASVDCINRTVPDFDPGALERLTVRFGSEVVAWFDELPHLLTALAELWQLELGAPIPRGTASAVFSCRMTSGRRAVLKVSPDRPRLALEAAALAAWRTVHTPTMIAFDEPRGAMLLEAIGQARARPFEGADATGRVPQEARAQVERVARRSRSPASLVRGGLQVATLTAASRPHRAAGPRSSGTRASPSRLASHNEDRP